MPEQIYILSANGELYHYGVPGMKWGHRKKYFGVGTGGIVADKSKGQQPSWQYKKSDRQKRWEDNHGVNPHRPNGTSRKPIIKKSNPILNEYQKERNRQKKHLATKRAIDLGSRFVNQYMNTHNVTLNGKRVGIHDNAKLLVNTMLSYKYTKDSFK